MLEMSHFGRSHLLPRVVFASVLVPPFSGLVVIAFFPDYFSSLEMSNAFFIPSLEYNICFGQSCTMCPDTRQFRHRFLAGKT